MAVLLAAATAAKSAAVAEGAETLKRAATDALAAIGIGVSKNDRERFARVQALLQAALNGDESSARQLAYNAFESASLNLPGDNRVGLKGFSPPNYRGWSREALAQYAKARGGLPASLSQYADRIGAPVIQAPPTVADTFREAITGGIREGVAQGAAQEVQSTFVVYRPWIIGSAIAIAALVAWRYARKG